MTKTQQWYKQHGSIYNVYNSDMIWVMYTVKQADWPNPLEITSKALVNHYLRRKLHIKPKWLIKDFCINRSKIIDARWRIVVYTRMQGTDLEVRTYDILSKRISVILRHVHEWEGIWIDAWVCLHYWVVIWVAGNFLFPLILHSLWGVA